MLAKFNDSGSLFLDHPGWAAFGLVMILLLLQIEILIHEFGHWVMAKACGYLPVAFSVGEGTLLWRKELPSGVWKFHFWPLSGYIMAVKTQGMETRWQSFLLSFGGPLFSGFCVVANYFAYQYFKELSRGGEPMDIVWSQILAITLVLSVVALFYNVWPSRGGESGIANDGSQMLHALRSKSFPRRTTYERAMQRPSVLGNDGPTEVLSVDAEAAALYVEFYRALVADRTKDIPSIVATALALPGLSDRERLGWTVVIADAALDHPKDAALLRSALEAASTLSQTDQQISDLSLMLGAIHIELCEHLEGRRLLYAVERSDRPPDEKAFAIAYLAISDYRQGAKKEASDRLRIARKLCPTSSGVYRADKEIHGGFYGRNE